MYPPQSSSNRAATNIGVRSSRNGPTTWTPTEIPDAANGNDGRRQIRNADQSCPPQAVGVRTRLTVDQHDAVGERSLAVVGEREHRQHRAQQDVIAPEPVRPEPADERPMAMELQPAAMVAAEGLAELAFRAERYGRRDERHE